ncbi:MAG: hypothetical protein JW913_05290 [Chitinispirillaceae bacterium]|nr:hypothetical protein [Chitinispirillaceae bacterium]
MVTTIMMIVFFRHHIYCLIYPGIVNTFQKRVKISEMGLKQSYFWVFDKKEIQNDTISYGGLHYWYGFYADIELFPNAATASTIFFKRHGPYTLSAKNSNFYWVHELSDSCFTYGYKPDSIEYISEIMCKNRKMIIRLTQASYQKKYMKEEIAIKLVKDFLPDKK